MGQFLNVPVLVGNRAIDQGQIAAETSPVRNGVCIGRQLSKSASESFKRTILSYNI
jgi:hypothetical protein